MENQEQEVKVNLTNWPVIKKDHPRGLIPLGYMKEGSDFNREGGDPKSLVPDTEMIALLELALDAMDTGTTIREACDFINAKNPPRLVSHVALNNLWKKLRGSDPNNERAQKLLARKENAPKKTPLQKERKRKQGKLGAAKRKLNFALREIEKTKAELEVNDKKAREAADLKNRLERASIFSIVHPEEEVKTKEKPIFEPNPGPQTMFLAASEQEVLYGGAAGGGKSYGLIADPMRYFTNENFVGLILRRTNDELREIVSKSQMLYPRIFKGAKYHSVDKEWRFPSGARLWMTYLERDDDVMRYHGQAFSYIGFDELTQHPTPYAWDFMRSRLRSTDPSLPLQMRATTNPGGPGHGWVKRMFVDPAPAGIAFPAQNIETGEPLLIPYGDPDFPKERWGKPVFYRRFIPAKLVDNPYLAGGEYKANLLTQSDQKRKQLLEGDWNISDGAAFSEYREHIHTCRPHPIPSDWRRFRSCDFGYASQSVVHWYAIEPQTETLVVYRELAVSKKTAKDLAELIKEAEKDDHVSYGVLDSSCWHVKGITGPTIAEEMIRAGVPWRPSDRTAGSRVMGKNRLHELLKVDERTGRPGIIFFDTCRQIITDLPVIPTDPKGNDDIDIRYTSDHAYDSIRYGIMSRPRGYDPWYNPSQKGGPRGGYRPSDPTFGY